MSAALLALTLPFVRGLYAERDVPTVRGYGGEFHAAALGKVSIDCPAIMVTTLGWHPTTESRRLTGRHVRRAAMAAFIVTAGADRVDRLSAAATLAESLAIKLRLWVPDCSATAWDVAPLEEDPAAENLYGRQVDAKGLALWLVRWEQCIQPRLGLDLIDPPLGDLVQIDITDRTRTGSVDSTPPGGVVPAVFEDVQFPPLAP